MTNSMRRKVTASSHELSSSDVIRLVTAYKNSRHGAMQDDWKPKQGFLYVAVRAISARVNQNFDSWPSAELKKSYRSFIGKPIFVNHQNFDPSKARGKVIAARYLEDKDDRYIETVMEVDAQRFPKLAKEIRDGGMDSVSMGVEAGETTCSVCGNLAKDEDDFCDHVRNHKGKTLRVKDAKTGKMKDQLVYEDCLVAGTLIMMGDGTTRPVEDIRAGDVVLDHLGEPRTVTQKMSRLVDEDTFRIRRQSNQTQAPQMTGNHPVLAIRGESFGKDTFTRTGRLDRGLRPEFVEARELRVGDWVCEPHPSTDGSLVKILTASYTRQSRQHETCFEPIHVLPDALELTERLGRFIGLFLAEGSVNKALTQADFAFHQEEVELASFVDATARELLGLNSITHREDNGGRTVTIFSSPLAQLLAHFGVGAANKALPDEFMSAPIEFLRGIVTGHEDGDGSHVVESIERHGHKHFTCSPRLAEQLYTLHVMLGNTPYHSTKQVRSDYEYPGKNPSAWLPQHVVGYGNPGQKKVGRLSYGPWTFVRINEIDTVPYSGPVYNMEVADTHTYVAEGMAVHNCFKLGFFELSFVFDPADETAVASRVMVANKRVAYSDDDEDGFWDIDTANGHSTGGLDTSDYSGYQTYTDNGRDGLSAGGNGSSSSGGGGSAGGVRGGTPDGSGILPNARGLYDSILSDHPDLDIGGYRVDDYHEHDSGALDVMTSDPTVAESVKQKAFDAGAPYVLWNQTQYNSDGSSSPMKDRGSPTQNHMDHVHTAPFTPKAAVMRRRAYGETRISEDIDTLRDEDNDSLDDYEFVEPVDLHNPEEENPFQHWIESPSELSGPNFDNVNAFDNQQEADGLDKDRLVENFGDFDGAEQEAPNRRTNMARTRTAAPRKRASEGEDPALEALEEMLGEDLDGDDEAGESEDHAEIVLGDEDSDEEVIEDELDDDDSNDDEVIEDELQILLAKQAQRRRNSAKKRRRTRNKGQMKGSAMSPASRNRRQADTSGHVDSGPFNVTDQGDLEQAYISQVPAAEAVAAPTDGSNIKNTENNLVASIRHKSADLQRELRALQAMRSVDNRKKLAAIAQSHPNPTIRRQAIQMLAENPGGGHALDTAVGNVTNPYTGGGMQPTDLVAQPGGGGNTWQKPASRKPYRQTVAMIAALHPSQRKEAAARMAYAFKQENPRFSPRKFFAAINHRIASDVEEATTVDPALSGTDEQGLKGSNFDNVALDNVETQPKDASKKVFAAFEAWLRNATGRTASSHDPNWLRRQAARWASAQGIPVAALYPSLGNALRQARNGEGNKGGNMNRKANESLDVAAPDARIDVEAPVKNDTDADAQASQYDLHDFGNNAGDNIADPDLSADSQIWAPGEKSASTKMASGITAVRYAESYIRAGLAPETDRWKLAKQAETMREAVVVDRTRLLEAVATANAPKRTAAAQSPRNGLPRGLTSSTRVASTQRIAAGDPANDSALFF